MNAMMQSVRGMGTTRVITLGVVGVVMLVLFGLISFQVTSPVMAPLYSNVSIEEGGEIISRLDGMNIPYKVGVGGTQILVPSAEVARLRLTLAKNGLPSKGSIVGYEIFDKSETLGTSSFVHNVNLIRALEGELGRTISSLDFVTTTRVHLVIPRRQIFNREKITPTASVVLTLKDKGRKLNGEETKSISNLVATAVPGLDLSHITIIDSNGKLLARGAEEDDGMGGGSSLSNNAEEYRINFENRTKRQIEKLLEQSIGPGRVRAEITADISFDRITTNSEVYDPDGQVVRSTQTSEEKEQSADRSNTVSVANNLPESLGSETSGGGVTDSAERLNETTNYEISKTITNHIREVGIIERVSVAVLVDGTYAADDEGSNTIYQPRSDEELEKIRSLVRSAIGFDEERGDSIEVVNMRFSREQDDFIEEEEPFDWLKRDLHNILKTLVIGVVAVLVILLVIRPLVNRAFEMSASSSDDDELEALLSAQKPAAATPTGGPEEEPFEDEVIDVEQIQTKMRSSVVKRVNEVVESNPDETLAVMRNWLNQK
jgi:flagellar M-ring protein FliF